jgi:hypothetical protein
MSNLEYFDETYKKGFDNHYTVLMHGIDIYAMTPIRSYALLSLS